jgi:hypothetical protein
VIHLEEYEPSDEIKSDVQLHKVLTDAVVRGQSVQPGVLYVTSVSRQSFNVSRSSSGGTTWDAQYVLYGYVVE